MASERIQGHIDRLLDEVDEAMRQLNWEQVRANTNATSIMIGERVAEWIAQGK